MINSKSKKPVNQNWRIIKRNFIMDTETITVHPKGEDFEITVQHDQTGSAYGMTLSKNAYEQLRQHFVGGSVCPCNELPDGEIAISSKALQKPYGDLGQTDC